MARSMTRRLVRLRALLSPTGSSFSLTSMAPHGEKTTQELYLPLNRSAGSQIRHGGSETLSAPRTSNAREAARGETMGKCLVILSPVRTAIRKSHPLFLGARQWSENTTSPRRGRGDVGSAPSNRDGLTPAVAAPLAAGVETLGVAGQAELAVLVTPPHQVLARVPGVVHRVAAAALEVSVVEVLVDGLNPDQSVSEVRT